MLLNFSDDKAPSATAALCGDCGSSSFLVLRPHKNNLDDRLELECCECGARICIPEGSEVRVRDNKYEGIVKDKNVDWLEGWAAAWQEIRDDRWSPKDAADFLAETGHVTFDTKSTQDYNEGYNAAMKAWSESEKK